MVKVVTLDEFIAEVEMKAPSATSAELVQFEAMIGHELPSEYRAFLTKCNGGYVGGRFWFFTEDIQAGVHHIGGIRDDQLSLVSWRAIYEGRIPKCLLWIHDDPFGNAICLGLTGDHQGRLYFWDHEEEPFDWDGEFESAGNISFLANSFTEYIAGLREMGEDDGS